MLQGLPDPISKEAKQSIMNELKELSEIDPDATKKISEAFKKEFNVPKLSGFITEARHGEFLSHAISKVNGTA